MNDKTMLVLTIIHVVISVVLVIAVLMQHGKQQGLSGAIAGGAETFFGKNKGRTIDAILKKVTAVVAILFVVSSLTLAAVSVDKYKKANEATSGADALTVDDGSVLDLGGSLPEGVTITDDATVDETATGEVTTDDATVAEVTTDDATVAEVTTDDATVAEAADAN